METISFYKEGKMSLQAQDKNKNSKPDVKYFSTEKKKRNGWKAIPT
jgi:hypothetical protein